MHPKNEGKPHFYMSCTFIPKDISLSWLPNQRFGCFNDAENGESILLTQYAIPQQ